LLPAGLPAPAAKWTGLAKYSFIGGNNDPDQVPVEGLIDAVNAVLKREGKTLATYGLASGPQGYRPLREFLTTKAQARRRHRLRRRRHPDRLRLAAGARPRQRHAARRAATP
jgi:DNA-binding transcriptional MocR family regulator